MTDSPRSALARDEAISSAVARIGEIALELPDDAARAVVWARLGPILSPGSMKTARAPEVPAAALVGLLASREEPWTVREVAESLYGGKIEIARVALNRAKSRYLVRTVGGRWMPVEGTKKKA